VALAVFVEPGTATSLAQVREGLRTEVDPALVVTGRPLMQEALARVIAREVVWFTGITLFLNTVIVLLQLRALGPAIAVMTPTVVVVFALLGGMELAGQAFTATNLVVLPLTLGIGVDNCVYLYERVREGHSIADGVRLVGRAITLTTCTTMAGFGFLAVSRYPGLAGLGWLAAIAIGLAFLAAVVFLPAFVTLLAHSPPPRDPA
jgi:predicted RND superfamily exporter protein